MEFDALIGVNYPFNERREVEMRAFLKHSMVSIPLKNTEIA